MAPGLTPGQFVQRAQARTAQCGKLCRYAEPTDCTNLLPSKGHNVWRAYRLPLAYGLPFTLAYCLLLTAVWAFIVYSWLRLCFLVH